MAIEIFSSQNLHEKMCRLLGGCLMQRQYIVKIIGNLSDWLSYAGGALIKVADSAGSTVYGMPMCSL